jgi:hypothetical protein
LNARIIFRKPSFSQRSSSRIIESFKIAFKVKLLNKPKKFLNPCEISINAHRTKTKKFTPKFDKILGCYSPLVKV